MKANHTRTRIAALFTRSALNRLAKARYRKLEIFAVEFEEFRPRSEPFAVRRAEKEKVHG